MGIIADINQYMKWLTTTDLSMEELSTIIRNVEAGMQNENWQVHIVGSCKKVRKIRLILDEYPNGNGNHGGNNNGVL